MNMNTRTLLIPLLVVAAGGCVTFPGKRMPELTVPKVATEVEHAPLIRVEHTEDSARPGRAKKALKRARKQFPVLRNAGEDVSDPEYTIRLDAYKDLTEAEINVLSAYMMLLIPAFETRSVTVVGDVTAGEGRQVGTYSSTGQYKTVYQLHLIYAMPLTAPLMPIVESKVWKNGYRDVFIQSAMAIAEDQRSRPSPAAAVGVRSNR